MLCNASRNWPLPSSICQISWSLVTEGTTILPIILWPLPMLSLCLQGLPLIHLSLIHSYSFLILQISVVNLHFFFFFRENNPECQTKNILLLYVLMALYSSLALVTVNHCKLIQLYDQRWLNKEDLQRMNILILYLTITLLTDSSFLLLFFTFYAI